MKFPFRAWRWNLAATAALACSANSLWAQQPLTGVKVAEPVATSPAAAAQSGKQQPTPAAPPAPASGGEAKDETKAGEPQAPGTPAPLGEEPAASPLTPAPDMPTQDEVVELIKERYPSGAIKVEREVMQDEAGNYLLHGAWRQFDERGRLIIDGRLVKNLKDGLWRRFYRGDETPLFTTTPYKDFTAPFISSATFYADRLHGKWTMIDSKQRKVHELEFIGGERHGKAVWYFPTGKAMLEAPFEHGSVNGDVLKYAADGTVLTKEHFEAGRMLSAKVEYFDQAHQKKKAEIGCLFATLVVKTPDSWEQGKLATFETRGQDEKHGPFIVWHSNGQVAKQGEYRYNLPVGQLNHWFPNAQKQLDGVYVDGRQEGVWTWWHENGQKAITGEYHDARPIGPWIWWTPTGKVAQRADLSHDPSGVELTSETQSDLRETRLQHVEPGLPMR